MTTRKKASTSRKPPPGSHYRLYGVLKSLPKSGEVLAVIQVDGIRVEKEIHQTFKHKRGHGEWFSLNEADINHIKSFGTLIDHTTTIPAIGKENQSKRQQVAHCKWRSNQRIAKKRKRENPINPPDEPETDFYTPKRQKPDCVIILRFPKQKESRSIIIHRSGDKFMAVGKITKLSGLLTRLGIVIDGMTQEE